MKFLNTIEAPVEHRHEAEKIGKEKSEQRKIVFSIIY
jgi:hypothetical protein